MSGTGRLPRKAPVRRSGQSVIRKLATLLDHALDGRVVALRDDVSGPLTVICADRISRLSDEPEDVMAIVELLIERNGLPGANVAIELSEFLFTRGYPPFFHAWLDFLVKSLTIEQQSSLFALAVAVWSISEAKCGPVNRRSAYTPSIDRVLGSVDILITGDYTNGRLLIQLISSALRNNAHLWQIKGRLGVEWEGE